MEAKQHPDNRFTVWNATAEDDADARFVNVIFEEESERQGSRTTRVRIAADQLYALASDIQDGRLNTRPNPIPDRRCGCSPGVTQVECPYHGGAI